MIQIVAIFIIIALALALANAATGGKLKTFGGSPSMAPGTLATPLHRSLIIRNDAQGQGYYHAPRGNRLHQGVDFVAAPGTGVYAPISGSTRVFQVYPPGKGNAKYKGIEIKNSELTIKLMYVQALSTLPAQVSKGTLIGTMQNRAAEAPGMVNHLHFEMHQGGTVVNPEPYINTLK